MYASDSSDKMDSSFTSVKCHTASSSTGMINYHRQSSDWSDGASDLDFYLDRLKTPQIQMTPPPTSSDSNNTMDCLTDYTSYMSSVPYNSSSGVSATSCTLDVSSGVNCLQHVSPSMSFYPFEGASNQTGSRESSSQSQITGPISPSFCSTPCIRPIDISDQERAKLEHKRQRNRLAASKCRKNKIEKINKLEEKLQQLKRENQEKSISLRKYKEQLENIKVQIMTHAKSGCSISLPRDFTV